MLDRGIIEHDRCPIDRFKNCAGKIFGMRAYLFWACNPRFHDFHDFGHRDHRDEYHILLTVAGWSRAISKEISMTFPDDDVTRELSIEELDAVAAGGWLGDALNWVGHELKSFFTNPVVVGVAGGLLILGGIVSGVRHQD